MGHICVGFSWRHKIKPYKTQSGAWNSKGVSHPKGSRKPEIPSKAVLSS